MGPNDGVAFNVHPEVTPAPVVHGGDNNLLAHELDHLHPDTSLVASLQGDLPWAGVIPFPDNVAGTGTTTYDVPASGFSSILNPSQGEPAWLFEPGQFSSMAPSYFSGDGNILEPVAPVRGAASLDAVGILETESYPAAGGYVELGAPSPSAPVVMPSPVDKKRLPGTTLAHRNQGTPMTTVVQRPTAMNHATGKG
ncbi:hypothetical protein B0F90DRAFT_1820693 [Multifurca ochricompacta]|uniref:Uncharacterized protein n=1 Tax=Multifurca ochricompacta TaxID=376703 RepID=A0AAD4LYH7_9AGAM|nr:hypothetical protein B0F90DRAFT_1820693 [Multifurca ochricompacta]